MTLVAFSKTPLSIPKVNVKELVERGLRENVMVEKQPRFFPSSSPVCIRRNNILANEDRIGLSFETRDVTRELYINIGNTFHKVMTDGLYKSRSLLFREYKLPSIPSVEFGGRVDAVIKMEGKIYGVEFKSCGAKIPTEPKIEHRKQAELYSAIMGIPFIILYVSRNVQTYGVAGMNSTEFMVEMNNDVAFNSLQTLFYTDILNKRGLVYHREWDENSVVCQQCKVFDACYKRNLKASSNDELNQAYEDARLLTNEYLLDTARRKRGILKHIMRYGIKPVSWDFLSKANWENI